MTTEATKPDCTVEGCTIELRAVEGTLRYLVTQASTEDDAADVFFTIAGATHTICAKLDACDEAQAG